MATVEELAADIMRAQRASRLAKHTKSWWPSMTPATDLGHACERRIVYHRCWPTMAQQVSEELASIFEEGNLHQTNVRTELAQLGFEVVEQEVNFRDAWLEITGTIDGKIILPGSGDRPRRIPVEIKSSAGGSPKTADEWKHSDSPLLVRYYAQIQTYLVLTNEPEGLGLFKDKMFGLWTVVPVSLDYGYAEGLLQRAERVKAAVARVADAGDDEQERLARLPDRIASREGCNSCPWRDTMCYPADAPVDGLLLANDAELASQLAERESLDMGRKRFAKLDDLIKSRFKLTKGELFAVGGYLISKKVTKAGTRIGIERTKEDCNE